jgi:hypothetical protein
MESPSGVILANEIAVPEEARGVVGRALRKAIESPMFGSPSRPRRIRVSDESLVDEIRDVVGDRPRIRVAPTPELDDFIDFFLQGKIVDDAGSSYLEEGRIRPETVGNLFRIGRSLHAAAPWKSIADSQAVRMDIPDLDVFGACVSCIGALGESFGLIIFPSLDALEAFRDNSEPPPPERSSIDMGTDWLAFTLEPRDELPDAMLQEIEGHGWPESAPGIYPLAEHRDRDGAPRPLTEHDIALASACASAFAAFSLKARRHFLSEKLVPVCMSLFNDDDLEVVFTYPYTAFPDFKLDSVKRAMRSRRRQEPGAGRGLGTSSGQADSARATSRTARFKPRAGRNAPCPCGSGRKYKKCHLASDEAEFVAAQRERREMPPEGAGPERPRRAGAKRGRAEGSEADGEAPPLRHEEHESLAPGEGDPSEGWESDEDLTFEQRMTDRLTRFAFTRFGEAFLAPEKDFVDARNTLQLALPWGLFHVRFEGRTILETYRDEHGRRCAREERTWIEAQLGAWLSIWEVTEVDPGRGMTLRDLLTAEVRRVGERTASQSLVLRDAILARVVESDDGLAIDGLYPRSLPPPDAAEIVRLARGRLRRKRAVPPERLQDETIGRYLIKKWEKAIAALDRRASVPPVLTNTDGDPLLLTLDVYDIEPGARAELEERLAAFPDVDPPPGGDETFYTFTRPGSPDGWSEGSTITGVARLIGGRLQLETNSVRRADDLRERIEKACEGLIRRRARTHTDPRSPKALEEARASRDEGPTELPPEVREILRKQKRRHYAKWVDTAIPALGNTTPRNAARTASGRAALDTLLKEMENREQRVEPPEERFDFGSIRRELGLEP